MMNSEYIKFVENDKNSVSDAIKPILSVGEFFFEAGAQSRQAEIDELQRKLNLCEALRNNQFEHLIEITEQRDTSQKYVIELRKRIDDALAWCEKRCVLKAIKILKGKNND